jgi:hypothetical protein
LTNNDTKKVEFKVNETTEKTVFKGTYTAKNNGNVNLDNVRIVRKNSSDVACALYKITGCADATDTSKTDASDITFTVRIDGKDVATLDNPKKVNAPYNGEEADFSPITVESGKSVSVEVIASIFADHETKSNLEYQIYLAGKDDNSNDA